MAFHPAQLVEFGMNRELAKKLMNLDHMTVAQLPAASAHPYRRGIIVTDASATTYNATVGVSGKLSPEEAQIKFRSGRIVLTGGSANDDLAILAL